MIKARCPKCGDSKRTVLCDSLGFQWRCYACDSYGYLFRADEETAKAAGVESRAMSRANAATIEIERTGKRRT